MMVRPFVLHGTVNTAWGCDKKQICAAIVQAHQDIDVIIDRVIIDRIDVAFER